MSGQAQTTPRDGLTVQELDDVLAVTRDFSQRELAPHALAIDDGDVEMLSTAWRGVCEIGLDRALLPESAGGVGLSLGQLLTVIEGLAVGEGGVAMLTLLSNAALMVLPDDAREQLGESARAVLVPLPECGTPGSHALKLDADTASGAVHFALGAVAADCLVFVGHERHDRVVFVASAAQPELQLTRDTDQLGLNGAAAASVEFDGAAIARIGGEDEATQALALVNAGTAAIARGIARCALDRTLEYAENRYQGGSMIIEYGAIRDIIARISERVRAIGDPASFAGYTLAGGGPRSAKATFVQALAVKSAAGDAAAESTIDAVQAFGGMGYMHETGIEKLMRDAKYCQLFPQSNWLARDQLIELERGPTAAGGSP